MQRCTRVRRNDLDGEAEELPRSDAVETTLPQAAARSRTPTWCSMTPKVHPERVAIGAAGDDRLVVRNVRQLIDELGFDPSMPDRLRVASRSSPGSPFAVTHNADELTKLLSLDH